MYELHEYEQYFFDQATLNRLTRFLAQYTAICCVCAPVLGKALVEAGKVVTILDVDERFATIPGYQRWDLYRPQGLSQHFDIIVCDPPFFKVSLSQLFASIRILSHNNFEQPILLSYLRRRSAAVLGTFARFTLSPTGYLPRYQTVQQCDRNEVEFFSNISANEAESLLAA